MNDCIITELGPRDDFTNIVRTVPWVRGIPARHCVLLADCRKWDLKVVQKRLGCHGGKVYNEIIVAANKTGRVYEREATVYIVSIVDQSNTHYKSMHV